MSDFQLEQWLPCHVDNFYQISDMGRVRSVARFIACGPFPGTRFVGERLLSPFACSGTGYTQIMIKRKKYNVHRLVATLFCCGYSDGMVVNHKNGNRKDNRAENLEWVTYGENMRHAFRVLGVKKSSLGKFGADSAVARQYIATCANTGIERYYPSGTDARKDGFTSDGISHSCKDGIKHKGFYWRKIDKEAFGAQKDVRFSA